VTVQTKEPKVFTEVPAGRYAMEHGGTHKIHFFKVDRPEHGKWKGYVFVAELIGDNTRPVREAWEKTGVLNGILRDVAGCLALYGQEVGECGHCGRTLTSEWRLKGIGPDCFKKLYSM
jgi:Family of unknown function (DUF6011)